MHTVVYAINTLRRVFMAVSLENRQDLPGVFEQLPNLHRVLDSMTVLDIQSLMYKYNYLGVGFFKIRPQPFELVRRDIRICPLEIFPAISLPITTEAGIKDDEMKATSVKRVI